MIRFRCECGELLKVKDEQAGRKIRCPECDEILRVPEPESAEEDTRPSTSIRKSKPRGAPADNRDEDERPRRRSRDEDSDDRPRRKRKTAQSGNGLLIGAIVGGVLLVVGGGIGLFLLLRSDRSDKMADGKVPPFGDKSRIMNAAARVTLQNNLKQIALSMHSHNDFYRRLPQQGFSIDPKQPNSKPLLSWRVAVLPFVEEENLYRQFKLDEPWDSLHNRQLLTRVPRVFQAVGSQPQAQAGHTYIQFVTGPGTLYPNPTTAPTIPRSFPDGTSITAVVVEAAEAVPWTKPVDVVVDVHNIDQGAVPKLGAFSQDGFFVGLGDGSVRFVERGRVSDKTIRQVFNPNDGLPLGTDW